MQVVDVLEIGGVGEGVGRARCVVMAMKERGGGVGMGQVGCVVMVMKKTGGGVEDEEWEVVRWAVVVGRLSS